MLDLMRDIILATDLAHHLRIFKDLQKMAEGAAPHRRAGVGVGFMEICPLNIWAGSVLSFAHSWLWCPSSRPGTSHLPLGVLCSPWDAVDPLWHRLWDPCSQKGQGTWALLPDSVVPPTVGYDRDNKQHHRLLLCLLMTSCDLSDQTKGWKTTRKIAVRTSPLS